VVTETGTDTGGKVVHRCDRAVCKVVHRYDPEGGAELTADGVQCLSGVTQG